MKFSTGYAIFFLSMVLLPFELDGRQMKVGSLVRRYFIVPCKSSKTYSKAFIFLHGLGEEKQNRKTSRAMQKILSGKDLLLIFPEGLKEAYPDLPKKRGWGPKFHKENKEFLDALVVHLKRQYQVKEFILGGFSNGAFFTSFLLQNGEENFQGYWVQGEGNIEKNAHFHKIYPIVLGIGSKDSWHIRNISRLKDFLVKKGWVVNKTLLFHKMDTGH